MVSSTHKEIIRCQNIAKDIRKTIIDVIYQTKGPHLGSSFSIVDILVTLYFKILVIDPKNPYKKNRDIFILSKGHAVPALYPILAKKGFFSDKLLKSFAIDNCIFEQHPNRDVAKGIEVTTGSLGNGLSIGAGLALAAKYDKSKRRVFVLLGDGELDEGSNWEAALFASHHKLDNLIAIVDYNKLQILGTVDKVLGLEPLAKKWQSFGWETKELNGHNFQQMINALSHLPFKKGKPNIIIAHTIKGKGVSFMENQLVWHSKCPNKEEYKKAIEELS
ncbi:MAG: transketolase [Patescibacteria group bacterium]|nr:transketolase [Patescibacteria group bacterium]